MIIDLYHTIVVPALARGYNVLTYEGPGHPTVRRRQSLGFIPDWERVVTPLVDYLLNDQAKVIDPRRLALFGYSFGCYLNARAAAFEPRLAAVLLDGGVWSAYESFTSSLPPVLVALLESGNKTGFDDFVKAALQAPDAPASLRRGIEQGLWSLKIDSESPYELFRASKDYTLEDVSDKIKMPVCVASAELDTFFLGQAQKVANALGKKATYHQFKGTAGYHCQVGALQELTREMFAWLNATLG